MLASEKRGHSNGVLEVIQGVMFDWFYLLMVTMACCLTIWAIHFVTIELDMMGMLGTCASLIETYTWSSLFIVCFLAIITYDSYVKHKRQRGGFWRDYGYDSHANYY